MFLILCNRSNKGIEDDEENNSGHGNGHGVRKIKISAIQQVNADIILTHHVKNWITKVLKSWIKKMKLSDNLYKILCKYMLVSTWYSMQDLSCDYWRHLFYLNTSFSNCQRG